MKKSKLLKSSKELFSRSFNPSKCKTALKLAGSRAKLLRNKKEAQVKQMRREISQLLESGHEQTARIRVEHVVREEKMMAAYDLIEIYCELIVARMQVIETQKTCPIDLKEAITSVIFASPRCGDVTELRDVKKHFTDKYGKDFVASAVELRPQSGVSRLIVEKLSATAPDMQTKIKILSSIAEEHNVKWDPKSFEDKDPLPTTDSLKGPRTFEETKLNDEPLQNNHRMHSSVPHTDHISPRTNEMNRGDEREQFSPGGTHNTRLDRQRWSMEFKDATHAAQAAAESAELASMAAKAAAELLIRDNYMRQYSTESDRGQQRRNQSFSEKTRVQNDYPKTGGGFDDDSRGGVKEFTQSRASNRNSSLDHDAMDVYAYSRKTKFEEVSRAKTNMQKHDDARDGRISWDFNIFASSEDRKFTSDGKDPFLSSGKGEIYEEISHDSSSGVVFDKSDSDSDADDNDFNAGFRYDDDHNSGFHFPSGSQKSPEHLWSRRSSSGLGNLVSPRKNSSEFPGNIESRDGSKLNDSVRSKSDESASGSDLDTNMSRRSRLEDSTIRRRIDEPAKSKPLGVVELDFGKLTGGLRHKDNTLPFFKSQKASSPRRPKLSEHKDSQLAQKVHYGSDTDSSEEEDTLRKISDRKPRQNTLKSGKEVKTTPSLSASNPYFSSDNSDSDKDPPKNSLTTTAQIRNAINEGIDKNPTTSKSLRSSGKLNYGSEKPASLPKTNMETRQRYPSLDKTRNSSFPGAANSSTNKEFIGNENTEAATMPRKDGSSRRASHVHPKLPDYDTLVKSLRKNRT
ncbi:uncharacterized protein LOC127239978 [Andrographis paniculata]|uniref:uncharacterized protein LOC127239978 n=1 Tax=Andrographis paniculata TaxID=175694 RepID=UPI0021E7E77F|nr:uncharacterized protein LOC127239978 [Andrographis paniculata]